MQVNDDYTCYGCTQPSPTDEDTSDESGSPDDELNIPEPSGVIPEYVLDQLGIHCGENVDPLACKVYTDTKSFIYTVSVDYKYKFENYAAFLGCTILQQGCIFEGGGGYRLDPRLIFGPGSGQVTWDRYLIPWNSNSSQPLFRAAWGLNSNGTVEMETFPLADGSNKATVILRPSVKNQSIYWNSQAIQPC